MRFKRYGWFEFNDTPRKRAAFVRKQAAERNAYPLFSDQIAEQQISVDEAMSMRAENWRRHEIEGRQHRAKKWKEARIRLRSYPDIERQKLLDYWQRCTWPADPTYLMSMMHMYDNGRLDLNPVMPAQTEAQRKAVQIVIDRLLLKKKEALCISS